jgi:hypothetical protein
MAERPRGVGGWGWPTNRPNPLQLSNASDKFYAPNQRGLANKSSHFGDIRRNPPRFIATAKKRSRAEPLRIEAALIQRFDTPNGKPHFVVARGTLYKRGYACQLFPAMDRCGRRAFLPRTDKQAIQCYRALASVPNQTSAPPRDHCRASKAS